MTALAWALVLATQIAFEVQTDKIVIVSIFTVVCTIVEWVKGE